MLHPNVGSKARVVEWHATAGTQRAYHRETPSHRPIYGSPIRPAVGSDIWKRD